MPITTTTTKSYKQFLRFAKEARKRAVLSIKAKFPDEVLELLEDGTSPTQEGPWEAEYSERYKRLIADGKYPGKTISPVNLKLKGKLYKSLKSKQNVAKGRITFTFTDKKAVAHDKGLGHLPKRRLFPESNEKLHANLRKIVAQSTINPVLKLAKLASDR